MPLFCLTARCTSWIYLTSKSNFLQVLQSTGDVIQLAILSEAFR